MGSSPGCQHQHPEVLAEVWRNTVEPDRVTCDYVAVEAHDSTQSMADLIEGGRTLVGVIGTVQRDNWDHPERAVFHSRVGKTLYLRSADPCDPASEPIPVYEGDEVVVLEHVSHMSIHTEPEGPAGFLISQRLVPVREEHGKVVARPLRHGEPDDGRRCHVRPGDQVEILPAVELDYIDEWEGRDVSGYVPLTPVLWAWMSLGEHNSEDKRRYLLAAARRLDQAQNLFRRIEELRQSDHEGAPATRRAIFELVGATELAVVSLSRAIDMCRQAESAIGTIVRVPNEITTTCDAVTKIRNAYEHIEDRALGNERHRPHPDALTIFKHDQVVGDGVIEYGAYRLDLITEVPQIIRATRQFLKGVAAEI